jgi:hypothetical protein
MLLLLLPFSNCGTSLSPQEEKIEVTRFLSQFNGCVNSFVDSLSPTFFNDALESGDPVTMLSEVDDIAKQFETFRAEVAVISVPDIQEIKNLKNAQIKAIDSFLEMLEIVSAAIENETYFTRNDEVWLKISELSKSNNIESFDVIKLQEAILIEYDITPYEVDFRLP